MTLFLISWLVIGFLSYIITSVIVDKELLLGDIFAAIFASFLGYLGLFACLFILSVSKGNIVSDFMNKKII